MRTTKEERESLINPFEKKEYHYSEIVKLVLDIEDLLEDKKALEHSVDELSRLLGERNQE